MSVGGFTAPPLSLTCQFKSTIEWGRVAYTREKVSDCYDGTTGSRSKPTNSIRFLPWPPFSFPGTALNGVHSARAENNRFSHGFACNRAPAEIDFHFCDDRRQKASVSTASPPTWPSHVRCVHEGTLKCHARRKEVRPLRPQGLARPRHRRPALALPTTSTLITSPAYPSDPARWHVFKAGHIAVCIK